MTQTFMDITKITVASVLAAKGLKALPLRNGYVKANLDDGGRHISRYGKEQENIDKTRIAYKRGVRANL